MKKKTVKKETPWLKLTAIVLVICFLIGAILAFVRFRQDPGTPYAGCSVELTFDGAASGKAPNGEKYDIGELTSDEVITEGLRRSGLEGKVTAEQVRSNLIVQGSYPENIISQLISYDSLMDFNTRRTVTADDYYPTLYSVKLYHRFDGKLSDQEVKTLLQEIVKAFRDTFAVRYAYVFQPEELPVDLSEYDYSQQLSAISVEISEAAAYAQEIYLEHSLFLYHGMSFNDICLRFTSLLENDINTLNASVTMNALTKNGARMYMQNEYTLFTLKNRLEKMQAYRDKVDELIAKYEKNEVIYLSTTESLTKIDGNSSKTYDQLVERRKSISDTIIQLQSSITTYEKRQEDLQKNGIGLSLSDASGDGNEGVSQSTGGPDTEHADYMNAMEKSIVQLREKQAEILSDFQAMLTQLNQEMLNEATMTVSGVGYAAPKLLSASFVIRVIWTAGPFCALGLIVCLALMIISKRREEKTA